MDDKIKKMRKPCTPISFFQPISTDFENNLTYSEYLLGVVKKLNSMIEIVNSHTEFINAYTGKIEEIEAEIAALKKDQETFKADITAEVEARFEQIQQQLNLTIAQQTTYLRAYTDTVASQLREEIQQVALGQIQVYDPTTGIKNDLQTVINNLYDAGREEALTAEEYDALNLTATEYDDKEITAFDYDQYGKTILTQ